MATSGSINFNQTRNEIVHDALALIGVYGVGRTISDEDLTFSTNMLNKMVKAWQAKGIHLWAKEEGVLFITDNTGEYTLSDDSTSARVTTWDDAVITELNGAHSAFDTALTVDTTTDMAASDAIGVVLDDDTIHWTTIVSVDTSTTLTITSGLASAAADNSNVYTYTSRATKPLRIHSMRRALGVESTSTNGQRSEIPMVELAHQDFMDLPTKGTNGITTHFYYNPDISTGKLYLWPRPDDPEYYFRFTYDRILEDFDASTDNADFPSEWLEVITYQLAYRLAPAFGKDKNMVQPEASIMLQDMLNWDSETVSVYLVPDLGAN